jgi:KaiC/GvpD/RAD55 family RecA-like ATPase
MHDFGWNPEELEKRGRLMIKRFDLFEVASQIEAMLEKAKGELYIDLKPLLVPKGFTPDVVIVDSLSAVSSVFTAKEETYRVYIEQLFRLLEDAGVTAFLIAESSDFDKKFTSTGVEEFLADGVILIYNLRQGSVRQSGIEILKMRGAAFEKKMAAMTIKPGQGIVVYPDQELFVE